MKFTIIATPVSDLPTGNEIEILEAAKKWFEEQFAAGKFTSLDIAAFNDAVLTGPALKLPPRQIGPAIDSFASASEIEELLKEYPLYPYYSYKIFQVEDGWRDWYDKAIKYLKDRVAA